jgi:hypothetical protein
LNVGMITLVEIFSIFVRKTTNEGYYMN